MIRIITAITLIISALSLHARSAVSVHVWPDSILPNLAANGVGVNLNYFTDGGRFTDISRPVDEAIKELGATYLRYPGGEKSDLYMFAKPPYDKASPWVTRTQGLEEYPRMFHPDGSLVYDPLDFDEYIHLCKKVGAEPVVVVAADRYMMPVSEGKRGACRDSLIRHAAEWVRYSNIRNSYGVKYWMIGNETWNANNPGSTPEIYADDVIAFSKAMKEIDPSILIVANGDKEEYFKVILENAGDYIDRLCVSNYGVYDFVEGYKTYLDSPDKIVVYPAMTAVKAMNSYATSAQLSRLKMIVAEYGTIDWFKFWPGVNDMGHAIVSFDMTGQLKQIPNIEFSCYWNTRWIDNDRENSDHDLLTPDGKLTPTGVAVKMWNVAPSARMIKCINQDSPAVIAYASIDKSKLYLHIINKAEKEIPFKTILHGDKHLKPIKHTEYFSLSPSDTKPVYRYADNPKKSITLQGYSINVVEYDIL